ncbi:hypothetical protein [Mycolicibacterium sp.]|uniref:hypothetical protein n=1 Tax=Mycolicibacterium sp. TaxID=2320850 RepID=UPI00355F0168
MSWQPSYASAAELAAWLGVESDAHHAAATEAASRAIDACCGRQFGQTSSSEFRYYRTYHDREHWAVDIDDLMTDTSLTVTDENGTELTEFTLWPRNAAAEGKPWRRIEFPRGVTVRGEVKIAARWGWANIPNAIKQATLIQAARFYDRRQNVAGPLTSFSVDDVSQGWAAGGGSDVDADVARMIRPYKRLAWVAA